jgi:hypothetical protein
MAPLPAPLRAYILASQLQHREGEQLANQGNHLAWHYTRHFSTAFYWKARAGLTGVA